MVPSVYGGPVEKLPWGNWCGHPGQHSAKDTNSLHNKYIKQSNLIFYFQQTLNY
jgi:hypothetical protein